VFDADALSTVLFWLVPVGASFLTTRYWSARDEASDSRHLWFGLYLVAVLVMVGGILATTSPERRLGAVVLFFLILVAATALQERRHRRQRLREHQQTLPPD
jgi:uncharacterized membrane protein YfcA